MHFNFGEPALPIPHGKHGPIATIGRVLAPATCLDFLGRRIVVTFQGDDARQASVGGRLVDAVPERYTPELDAIRRRTIAAFDRHAEEIFFLNPDLADVLPARATFLPYASVDPEEWQVRREPTTDPPVVVHAPLDPRVKGTNDIVAAVDRLQAEGVPLRFELLQGVDRSAVRSALERSAIVVDQFNAGWYGGFAVEGMALGKPVVAALDLLEHPVSRPSSAVTCPWFTRAPQRWRIDSDPFSLRARNGGASVQPGGHS